MTSYLLVRHTTYKLVGKAIGGRQPELHLDAQGRDQAVQLGEALSHLPIEAIYAGPLERVRETAEPLALKLNVPLQVEDDFNEIEFGDWTNRTFAELDPLPAWQRWNSFRSSTKPPNGESMLEVQRRAVRKILELRGEYRLVTIFSHGDVIRAALLYFLGMPIDYHGRIEIDCGSCSLLELDENHASVHFLNWLPDRAAQFSSVAPANTTAY